MPQEQELLKDVQELKKQADSASLPPELKLKVGKMLDRLKRMAKYAGYSEEYERVSHYLDWVSNLPWTKTTPDILDLTKAKQVLDTHHYGLTSIKERILEYLAVLKLRTQKAGEGEIARAPILCLVGLVGTGKTTVAQSIAEAMSRKFIRIPFGGMGSARDLRGQSRLHLEAEPGHIIKSLRRAEVKNPVMLLDELDRISEEARSDVMGVLVELLDPEQNYAFIDHYLDYPFNLSQVLFIATANNTGNIATAVMDRLEPISMPSYSDEEKIKIAQDFLLPKNLLEAGMGKHAITIDNNIWPQIVRPLGYDAGLRTLNRTIEGIIRKVAKEIVEGKRQSVHLTGENIKPYLPSW